MIGPILLSGMLIALRLTRWTNSNYAISVNLRRPKRTNCMASERITLSGAVL